MRSSRTRETRGGSRKPLYLTLVLVLVVAVGVGAAYFVQGFGPLAAKDTPVEPQAIQAEAPVKAQEPALVPAVEPVVSETASPALRPEPTATPEPTQLPEAVPQAPVEQPARIDQTPQQATEVVPEAAPEPTLEEKRAAAMELLPDVEFGEVLEEGFGYLKLPGGELVDTWYTFQVDTRNGNITIYMAQFDSELESILTTLKVANYAQGEELRNADMTLYYSDGSERIISLDKTDGTIRLVQHYNLPFGPSVFSPPLRRELVFYGMELQDQAGDIMVELHLDVSGLSDGEEMVFEKQAPVEVGNALHEIRQLVDQIEEQRKG
jgi:hypothetical protein